jgi:hypothetical protein
MAPADLHKHIVTGAYVALTIAQCIIVWLLFRKGTQAHNQPPL